MLYEAIKQKQIIARNQSHIAKPKLPKKYQLKQKTEVEIQAQLENVGLESEGVMEHTRGRKRTRGVKQDRDEMDVDDDEGRLEFPPALVFSPVIILHRSDSFD
jgi:hypothetical protein